MRFLLGISILAIAACGGASSSELFGDSPGVVTEKDASPTEPAPAPAAENPAEETPPPAPTPSDAGKPPKDAGADVVDASLPEETKCSFDSDCAGDDQVCNWKTDTCAAPGPIGAPCKRDLECTNDLCNWKLTTCSDPAPAGTACRRNKECASGSCGANSICK